jgi:hypothetical protein
LAPGAYSKLREEANERPQVPSRAKMAWWARRNKRADFTKKPLRTRPLCGILTKRRRARKILFHTRLCARGGRPILSGPYRQTGCAFGDFINHLWMAPHSGGAGADMDKLTQLIDAMAEYEKGVPHRVGHFLKVHGYAKTIGELECLPEETQHTLETAAIVHDVGIKPSLEKYGSSAGKYQEREGGAVAREMLCELGFDENVIERVVFLVEHHHTYTDVNGPDYQILLEADFLVNMHEGGMSADAIQSAYRDVFKTAAGKRFCERLYLQQ